MRVITGEELNNLRKSQEDTFFDTCQIGTYSGATDKYGDIQKSWVYGSGIACGFQLLNGWERINGDLVYTGVQARVRLPLITVISNDDRIKFNTTEYGVKGIAGKYCLIVNLEHLEV